MSATTKKAIYKALSDDSALVALLGKDELNGPAIFNTSMNKLTNRSGWSYPCITFRESDGSADSRFRESTTDSEVFDLEVWSQAESAVTPGQIADRIDELLHNQVLILESGRNYDCVRFAQIPDQYDKDIKAHFGLYRYRLAVSR